jgi:16S rRNA (uracil1498-N3)-methyltransferase
MRQVRVYSADPLTAHCEYSLSRSATEHVLRVLRLRVGDALTLFDGRGGEYPARLVRTGRAAAVVEVGEHLPLERESPLAITLLQSLVRGEKMDWVVQKATELGVARVVPVAVGRSVVRVPEGREDRKLEHWRAVAAGACEQCGRNRLPQIDPPVDLPAALTLAASSEVRVLLSPEAPDTLSRVVLVHGTGGTGTPCRSIALLIGPEGGFEDAETAAAARHGFRAARFGLRVLRSETAAVAAITALQLMAGDLQGT